jgi:hypothetical protein
VITAEEKHYHVTASTRGFFLNHCTEEVLIIPFVDM